MIKYDDDNTEELSHNQMTQYRKQPKQDSSTLHECVENEYWVAQQLGRCCSPRIKQLQFSGEHRFAVKQLAVCTSWFNDPDFTSNGYYEYSKYEEKKHYANTVIDDVTGK